MLHFQQTAGTDASLVVATSQVCWRGSPCKSIQKCEAHAIPSADEQSFLIPLGFTTCPVCSCSVGFHLPRITLSLARKRGCPNSLFIVFLALPWHNGAGCHASHSPLSFSWTAGSDLQKPWLFSAEILEDVHHGPFQLGYNSLFLNRIPWMCLCLVGLANSFCTAWSWMALVVQCLITEAIFSSCGKWEWNCLN